jgi:hypothetical protein
MDSDYSDEGYAGSSEEQDASLMDSDDDYAFDNAAAPFSSKSKVGAPRSVARAHLLRACSWLQHTAMPHARLGRNIYSWSRKQQVRGRRLLPPTQTITPPLVPASCRRSMLS